MTIPTDEEIEAIRARNEQRKERFFASVERAIFGGQLKPDFAISDIDALLAEVERLRVQLNPPVCQPGCGCAQEAKRLGLPIYHITP